MGITMPLSRDTLPAPNRPNGGISRSLSIKRVSPASPRERLVRHRLSATDAGGDASPWQSRVPASDHLVAIRSARQLGESRPWWFAGGSPCLPPAIADAAIRIVADRVSRAKR